jgi:hypothetical protein
MKPEDVSLSSRNRPIFKGPARFVYNSALTYTFFEVELATNAHPSTWEKIDPAMLEIGFEVLEQWKNNTSAIYRGLSTSKAEVEDHLNKAGFAGFVRVSTATLPDVRFKDNGVGSTIAEGGLAPSIIPTSKDE